jgi:hypothetical protein
MVLKARAVDQGDGGGKLILMALHPAKPAGKTSN